jgi:ABC-type sugar transport system substrate-binding protein
MKRGAYLLLILVSCFSLVLGFSFIGCKAQEPEVIVETVTEKVTETVTETVVETVVEEGTPKIGYITRLAVPWWVVCEKGFSAAGADYGFEPIIYDPPQLTVEDQVRVMETWISAGLDGIIIGPNDPAATIGVINQAIDAGIPAITGYGVDSPESNRLAYVGYAAYELGLASGKGMVAMLELQGIEPPGKISYHTGGMASTEDVAALEGFTEPLEEAGFEVIEPVLDEGDAAKAIARASEVLALYPDLKGMLTFYDYTGPAVGKAVTDAGKIDDIVVISDGFIGEMVQYLESGAIDASIDLVQYEGSYIGGEMLYKLSQAGQEGWDDVLSEYSLVDKELILGVGFLTYEEVGLEMWPEIGWMMDLETWKTEFPDVWEVLG